MSRVTITFDEMIYSKLNETADKKNISLSQYVRDLVNIGLKVEEMSTSKDASDDKEDPIKKALEEYKKLIQKDLTANYENLYLTRYLVSKMLSENKDETDQMLDKAKTRSQAFVEGLIGENT